MLYNSATDTGFASQDIQKMMDDPNFGKRVSKLAEDVCIICMNDLYNTTNEYQLQCPAKSCRYSLCHACMKRVFQFKYIQSYSCFICRTQYQLEDAEHLLNERMASLDDPILKLSFKQLIENLPNEFKPEIIRTKKQQHQKFQSLKGFQDVLTTCVMNPDMTEEQAEEISRRMPNLQEILEEQPHESDAVEEVGAVLSSTCAPTFTPSSNANVEHENQIATRSIWAFICDICSSIWNNIKRFGKYVRNLIFSLCTSLCQFLPYCPISLREKLKQQLDKIKHSPGHSHQE
jgi:DNA-binding transcriptional MerR regulator